MRRSAAFVLPVLCALTAVALADTRSTVEVVLAGSTTSREQVKSDLIPHLEQRGFVVNVKERDRLTPSDVLVGADDANRPMARAFVDLAPSERASLYLLAGDDPRVVLRTVPTPTGLDGVAVVEMVEILIASFEAVRAGKPLPRESGVVTRVLPTEPPEDIGWAGDAGMVATAEAFSADLVRGGFGLTARFERRWGNTGLGVWATVRWLAPAVFEATPVQARVTGGSADVLLTMSRTIGTRVTVAVGAGPAWELRRVEPQAADDVELTERRTYDELVFSGRLAARLDVRLAASFGLFVGAAVDAAALQGRYTIEQPERDETVLEPWRLRPSLQVGLVWGWGRRGL